MLEALKFVQGAVAKKDFVPALTHYRIEKGRIKGYNGAMALSSPIDLDLEVTPKAATFAKAIKTCTDTVAMSVTPGNRLSIKSGTFKAFIECTEEPYPEIEPEGTCMEIEPGLVKTLKELVPFMGQDASRPWSLGVLLKGGSVFATNNILLVECWLGYCFPVDVNIPAAAIKELVRIGKDPTHIQAASDSITFHFEGDRWLRTQVTTLEWPDLSPILDRESNQCPIPDELFTATEALLPFVDDMERLFILNGEVATVRDPNDGASIEVPSLVEGGCFNAKQLLALNGHAKTIDLTQYPAPCLFYGDNIRGVIIGIRM